MANKEKRQRHKQKQAEAAQRSRQKQAKKIKRANIMCAVMIAVFALVLLGYGFYRVSQHMDFFYQHGTAVRADGESLTAADYNFYFYRGYYEYMNNVGDSADGFGAKPSVNRPLSSQLLYDDESETWEDFFIARADRLIERTFLYYHLAQEQGYTLTEEQLADIQYDFDEKIWFEAEEVNQTTIADYLTRHYGKGMTEEIYKRNLTILYTANFFADEYENSIEISDEELDAYYQEHQDDLDIVTYREFYLSGKAETDSEQQEKMQQAEAHAQQLAASAKNEADMIALSEEYQAYNDELSYWTGASISRMEQLQFTASHCRDWLRDPSRQAGDTKVTKAANGYYVTMFLARSTNDYETVNLRYFTISGDDAQSRKDAFFQGWNYGGKTPEAFFAQAEEYRDVNHYVDNRKIDVITHTRENRSSVPACMRAWCFDEARTAGEVTSFEAEDGTIYVVYFDGYDTLCSRALADKQLRSARFRAWQEESLDAVRVRHSLFFYLAGEA